ncbi:MAG TPA: DUF2079 domain-containing protein [Candidatus Sulfotelmatobacter sp.]|jgi:uncharacterized membrane protein|nr:DUF2079 domain-containing protein [Candidatus Sulfotelmatobacter sp.]
MSSQLYSFLKFFIGWPLTILALFFIIKIIISQAPPLLSNFHIIHFFLLGYGISSFILFYFLRSYVWYRILKQYHYTISFRESSYLWALSELKRYIPGNIWSFFGRTVLFHQKNIKKKDIAKGLIIEAELFIIGSIIISLLSLQFYFTRNQSVYEWIIGLVVFGLTVLYCLNGKVYGPLPDKIRTLVSFLFPSFVAFENIFLVWISIIALFFFGVGNYFVISSVVYLTPKLFLELIGVFDLAFVVGYLSVITPAGFGIREGIVLFSLTKIIPYGLAAFGTIFCRIILIFSEMLFISISIFWYRTKSKVILRLEKIINKHSQVSIVTALSLLYLFYFTIVSFFRYDNFYTGRFDLGNMAQTVWNSLHGRIFLFTNPNGTEPISRLAFHADFILILLAPFYALWQNPKMLLLIQTIVVAAGAYFVYVIARDVLKHRNLALAFTVAYLLNPSVQRANIYDFHAVTLVTTLFLATFYFFFKKRYILFTLFAILAALCKEEIWLIISLFGILVFFIHKKRVFGTGIFLFSIFMFYFLFWYAIPKTLGSQHFALVYLSDFGDSPTKIIKEILLSPNKVVTTILHPSRLDYLNQLFLPVGYLLIFFPFFLIFAVPDLLINILSNNTQLHQIYYQYTATITPFIFLAAIYGAKIVRYIQIPFLKVSQAYWNLLLTIYLLIFSFYGAYAFGPLPGARDPNLDMFIRQVQNRAYIDSYLKKIPKKKSVAASNDIGSHLSLRENIYTIPYGLDRADVIVLLLNGTDSQSKIAYAKVIKDPRYREAVNKKGFVAFIRK